MTLQKAVSNIYGYFSQNPNKTILNLNIKEQIRDLNKSNLIITELSDNDILAIYTVAAQDLEKMDLLRSVGGLKWVLKTEISQLNQKIDISGSLAHALERVNNELALSSGLSHRTQATNIGESDISFLVIYVSELLLKKDNKTE
jgi:hypothetical protein